MIEEKKETPAVRPFFIEATGGTGGDYYVSSASVAYLYNRTESGKEITAVYTNGDNSKYTSEALIHAPVAVVKDIFREHGYDFVSRKNLAERTQAAQQAPQPG